MTQPAPAPAADDTVYLNVYTLYRRTADSDAFFDHGVFVECLGTCAPDSVFDTLLALPARPPRPNHFIFVQSHPGEDFTNPPSPSP